MTNTCFCVFLRVLLQDSFLRALITADLVVCLYTRVVARIQSDLSPSYSTTVVIHFIAMATAAKL